MRRSIELREPPNVTFRRHTFLKTLAGKTPVVVKSWRFRGGSHFHARDTVSRPASMALALLVRLQAGRRSHRKPADRVNSRPISGQTNRIAIPAITAHIFVHKNGPQR